MSEDFLGPYKGRTVWYVHGPMGCGKTTNGRAICEFLGAESFRDDDVGNRRLKISRRFDELFASIPHGTKSVVRFAEVGLPVSPVTATRVLMRRNIEFNVSKIHVVPSSEDVIYMLSYNYLKGLLELPDSPVEFNVRVEPDVSDDKHQAVPDAEVPCSNSPAKTRNKVNTRVEHPWHTDAMGNKNADALVEELFLHVATSHLYRVTGYSFDATSDEWCIHYKREMGATAPFSFTRTMSDFLTPGKFVKVK